MADSVSFAHRFVAPRAEYSPVLILLHGTGGNEDDLLPLGQVLGPGAALLSPRGKVLENGMPRFFRRLAEGVFDVEDLQRRTHELADWLEEAVRTYGVEGRARIVVGYSNGANIAASLLLLRPGVLQAAVLFRPMVPLEPEVLPDMASTRVFIGAARFDGIVRPEETERLAHLLERAGAEVTTVWLPASHGLTPEDISTAAAWLNRQGLV